MLSALPALDLRFATTNYDGLIEQALPGLEAVTWRDGEKVQQAIGGDRRAVVHLHGYWDEPESVVLGIRSYDAVMGSETAQALQRALVLTSSLLLVGVGAGLEDPNFEALRGWLAAVLPGSRYQHYRLVSESEVDDATRVHAIGENVRVVCYGATHADLAPFLESLAPPAAPVARPGSGVAHRRAVPGRLPPRPRCIGRDDAIGALVASVLRPAAQPVAVLGAPGIGKSTLCLAMCHDRDVAARFAGRRWFVRCDGARRAEALAAEIARAIGLAPQPDSTQQILAELGRQPALLVLDNAETPWEADVRATEDVLSELAAIDGVVLVAALRGRQRPLGPDWSDPVEVPRLAPDDARRVFLAVAGAQYADDAELDALIGDVDGVPLAVTLLAHAAEGAPQLGSLRRAWYERRIELLDRGVDAGLGAAASFELSIAGPRMTPEARRLLAVLALLPAGVTHTDIDRVFDDGEAAAMTLRRVGLAFDEADRLRVLKPIRDHCERHHRPEQADLTRVLDHYAQLATQLGRQVGGDGGGAAAVALMAEIANLTNLLPHGLASTDARRYVTAALALVDLARLAGADLGGLLEDARAAASRRGDATAEANCIKSLGDIALARSDHDGARARYEQALPLYQRVGDVLGEANCISSLGDIARARSDHDGARAGYEQALPLYQRVGAVLGEANCIREPRRHRAATLRPRRRSRPLRAGAAALPTRRRRARRGELHQEPRRHRAARAPTTSGARAATSRRCRSTGASATCSARRTASRASATSRLRAPTTSGAGRATSRRCRSTDASAPCSARRTASRASATSRVRRSDHERRRAGYEQALPLYRRVGAVLGEANCIRSLGDIALRALRPRRRSRRATSRRCRSTDASARCSARRTASRASATSRLPAPTTTAARARYEQALPLYRRVGDVLGEANCIKSLGDIALARSDHDGARARYDDALARYVQIAEPYSIGMTHKGLARVAPSDDERAAHLEAARQAWHSIGRQDLIDTLPER